MKKFYAKEIPYDAQEAWGVYYNEEMACDNHIFLGRNRYFETVNADLVNETLRALEGVCDDIQYELNHNFDCIQDITIDVYRSIIEDHVFRKSSDKAFTDDEIISLIKLADRYSCCSASTDEELRIICDVLSILYEEPFAYKTLRGCGQSDWIECIYPHSHKEDLAYIEAVFFSTGSEFAITTEAIESSDDFDKVDTYADYCIRNTEDEIKKWVAEQNKCSIEEVSLLLISNTRTIVQYDYKEV